MQFNIISLFPEFFSSPLQTSLMAKAQESGIINISLHDPRKHAQGLHKQVDDTPYGGGPGMVLMLDPLVKTLRELEASESVQCENSEEVGACASSNKQVKRGRILVMSPAGKPFTQAVARELAQEDSITLVCGRYEGFDARLEKLFPVEYFSMGDAVLNGGEVPALAIVEAVARLIPGFMGKEDSGNEESFSNGLLEYPHYTRPDNFEGHSVPDVLRSGHHEKIQTWRHEAALERTLRQRPDLLQHAMLTKSSAAYLNTLPRTRLGRNLFVALVHHPVIIEGKNSGTASITNLDVHDIARSCRTYGLGGYFIVQPLKDQQDVLHGILRHWLNGAVAKRHADRAEALSLVHVADSIGDVIDEIAAQSGEKPMILGSSAEWHENKPQSSKPTCAKLSFETARQNLKTRPCLLLLGTGHGLAPEVLNMCDAMFPPIRFLSDYNHLSVRAAAVILLDRLLQEIY